MRLHQAAMTTHNIYNTRVHICHHASIRQMLLLTLPWLADFILDAVQYNAIDLETHLLLTQSCTDCLCKTHGAQLL